MINKHNLYFSSFNLQDSLKDIYVLGSSLKGKSGTGEIRKSYSSPTKLQSLKNIEQISCGRNFCLALNDSNQVFSWGDNTFGQLGGSEKYKLISPEKIKILKDKKVVKVRLSFIYY